jgi:DNA-binding CsgD family transcriptional regulator
MAGLAPLFGRDDLMARASRLLDGSPSGDGASPHADAASAPGAHRGLVLVGEAGVGKSRLAAEIVRLGTDRGYLAVSTIATQAASAIPLGALSHLLPNVANGGNVLAAARTSLVQQAAGRTLLLSIDDAHLLDDHSAALVLQLAMSMPSFLVATVRSGETVPDPVLALWKDGLAERVDVGRLDDAAITDLAAHTLGGPLHPGLAALIADRADGNALIARELCLAGRDAGVIASVDDRWTATGDLGVSPRLVELVTARIDVLDAAERLAIEVIAHGEPLGFRLAVELVDQGALLSLERRGVIALRDDARRREVWLIHPIYADVVRATTGAMLAAALKGRLATATVATGMRRRSDLLRVATWQLEAGSGDADRLQRAATETYHAGDMIGTARLAAGAWDIRPGPDAGLLLATALAYTGRHEEADAIFTASETLAADGVGADDATLARIAIVHAAVLSAGLGQPDAAIQLLTDVEASVKSPAVLGLVRAQRAHLLALSGEVEAALAIAEPLLATTRDGPALVTATMASVIALQLQGAYQRVQELVAQALPETRLLWAVGAVSIPPEMLELEAYGARVSMGELNNPPAAVAAATSVARSGGMVVNRPVALLGALHVAVVELHLGRPRTAGAAIEAVGPVASDLLGAPAAAVLAICAALVGHAENATAALARSDAWRRPGSIFDPFLDPARIWTAVTNGRPEHARRIAADALETAIAADRRGHALQIAHTLARVGGAAAAHDALARIGHVDGPVAATMRAHVDAAASDHVDELEAVSDSFASLGAELLAAEAAAQAARAARRSGEARRATRLQRAALDFAARCEGAQTPSLVMPADELTPLSRRELEIANLAAGGLSSEEIASRVFLSVRTVDNHLQHVYQKLGIGSRAELRRTRRTDDE